LPTQFLTKCIFSVNKITTLFKGCQDLYTLCGEVCFQKCGDFTWRVSDYEELVGVTHGRWWSWF